MAGTRARVSASTVGAIAPFALFAAAWVAAVIEIACVVGRVDDQLAAMPILAFGVAVIWKLSTPAAPIAAPGGRADAQLAFLAAYLAFAMANALHIHGVIDSPLFAPLDALARWLRPIVGPPTRVMNALLHVVIPGLVLWRLGARRRELGLTRGHHTLRVTALCCAIPVAVLLVGVARGTVAMSAIGAAMLDNTLQNGVVEEIFWRGYVQTRLERFGSAWAILATALLFGLWHLGAQLAAGETDWLLAGARCITDQAMTGVALGVMFHRTRSVIAPSIFHVLVNTV